MSIPAIVCLVWGLSLLIIVADHRAEQRHRARMDAASIARAEQASLDAIAGFQVDVSWRFHEQMFPQSPHPVYDQLANERPDVVLPEVAALDDDERVAAWLRGAS
jgi:hypothetical protein